MNQSLWKKIKKNNEYHDFKKDVDVLIIGAGLSGINTAYFLKDSNLKVCLIDDGEIGNGASAYTTGKLTYLQSDILTKIQNIYDYETAKKYLDSQIYAINLICNIINENNIDCDLTKNDSYVFTTCDSNKYIIDKIYNFLKKSDIKSELKNKLPIDIPCKYSLKVSDTYVFNPVKYMYSLCEIIKEKINICENVRALNIQKDNDKYTINTTKGSIKAKYVVVTTQYPFFVCPGLIPFKTHVEKSHVVSSKIDKIENFNAINVDDEVYSIRYYKDGDSYIIFSSESYKMSNHINYEERQNELDNKFKKLFNLDVNYKWSTHDLISNDYLPIIGEVEDSLFISTAFNKWGMTNSVLSGKILSDLILKKDNDFSKLFMPNRKITLERSINFIKDTLNITKIFVATKINKNKSFYTDRVKFININGKNYGVYIDKNNKKHVIRNLCPHMKCSLLFNFMDKTWDCPCHGSKFDIDGNVIKGPSVYDIKKDI